MIYVRWKKGEDRRGTVHTVTAQAEVANTWYRCGWCARPLLSGDRVQLIAIGPVSGEAREKYEADRWHNAGSVLMHEACVEEAGDAGLEGFADQILAMDWGLLDPQ